MLITTKGMCEPFIASMFPSSSHTAEVFPCLSVNVVNEIEVMIVRKSFAYERRNRVAKTETVLGPLSLAMVVEYLLKQIISATMIQIYIGKTNCNHVLMYASRPWKKHTTTPRSKFSQAMNTLRNETKGFDFPSGKKTA